MPAGNPCASSTRRKNVLTADASDDSVKFTRGSSLIPPAANEYIPISTEPFKLTEAISKAMFKELAPLIPSRDQTRARPTLYKGTKDETIDRWLLLVRRFFERVHAKSTEIPKTCAIINHLEGEARNNIIDTSEPRFGTRSNKMHVRQTFVACPTREGRLEAILRCSRRPANPRVPGRGYHNQIKRNPAIFHLRQDLSLSRSYTTQRACCRVRS